MKNIIINISTFILILLSVSNITGQINRTLETKVTDILAQLPTKDLSHSDKLMEEIIGLDVDGILEFCDRLVPLGTGDDTQVRFALHSLAIYSGGKQSNISDNIVENAFIKAIEDTTDNEVRTFLIERLVFCGSNTSVTKLSKYLLNEKLYKSVLAVFTSVRTPEAANVIFSTIKNVNSNMQPAFIDALGKLNYEPAVDLLQELATNNSIEIQQKSLMALAEIALESSETIIYTATKKVHFNLDKTKAILAYIHYGKRLSENGNKILSTKVGETIMKNCTSEKQLHYRSAAVYLLRENEGSNYTKTLIKEAQHHDKKYREAVLYAASQGITSEEVLKWVKAYKKSSNEAKPQIIRMLSKRHEPEVFDKCILSAVKDNNEEIRISGIKALAYQDKSKVIPLLLESLKNATSIQEFDAIEGTLLRVCDVEDSDILAKNLNTTNDRGKVVLVNVLSARNANGQFNNVVLLIDNSTETVKTAVYDALPSISNSNDLPKLINLLNTADGSQNIKNVQLAIINVLDKSKTDYSKIIFDAYSTGKKDRVLPVLQAIKSKPSLDLVVSSLNSGNDKEKMIAIETLTNWRNNDALPILFQVVSTSKSEKLRSAAFNGYLSQISKSIYPDDQKLLLVKKLMPYSSNNDEKRQIINRAGNIKTFLSLIFVSKYIDITDLANTASYAAIRIALPTPGVKNGLSGDVVREIVTKSKNTISGSGSEYTKIDANEFLDNMSNEKGFVSIFNGKDLTGWEGLVKNPIERRKMSQSSLKNAQAKANEQMLKDWFVKDGLIGFKGEGYNNICTIKDYGDFEMIVDWKITNGGDSGIYLRGTPQVQIWDIARIDDGAQVGSGGLYNNKINKSIPLVVADNPINEWNTFRIKMIGERVTVHLNGVLVTNNVILENYWDRKLPIFTKEAIELQAHGEDLGFKNIYVREINSGDELLSDKEKKAGFKSLFNGKDLDQWIGNKKDYLVENNELVVRPKQGGHGNLYTTKEYSDFIFRFEFKLTPGANNGLGIHTPLEGDAAYVGKELQILDNTANIYANLKPYQYHGSVYGVITAKRGFLKPVGEWNSEEVIIKGDDIKITLNGTVILDANFKEATKKGTLDGKDHPGLTRNKGHIAFLGHGSELQFRNIRIKDLSESKD